MAVQLQSRIRPYIGQTNPDAWCVDDSSTKVKNEWRKIMCHTGYYQGEREYRIVHVSAEAVRTSRAPKGMLRVTDKSVT